MKKARVGIIVDNLNSSKQIFDFITASQKSNNYEVSHIIIQKIQRDMPIKMMEQRRHCQSSMLYMINML